MNNFASNAQKKKKWHNYETNRKLFKMDGDFFLSLRIYIFYVNFSFVTMD